MKGMRTIYALIQPYRLRYAILFVSTVFITGYYLLIPAQVGHFIAGLHSATGRDSGYAATQSIHRIAGMLIAIGVVSLLQSVLMTTTCEQVVNDLRARFFAHMLELPLDETLRKPLGAVASEFSSDLAIIQDGISSKLLDLLRNVLFTIGALGALLYVDLRMTVFSVVAIGAVVVVVLLFLRAVTSSLLVVQRERAGLLSMLIESVSNLYVIQAYRRQAFMLKRFENQIQQTYHCVRRYAWLTSLMNPVSLVVFSAVMLSATAYGIHELQTGRLQTAGLISYFTYSLLLIASVSQVSVQGGAVQQAAALALKNQHLLQQRPHSPLDSELPKINRTRSGVPVYVRDVSYRYCGTSHNSISDVSFEIAAGSIVAITGASGAGKSTLLGAMMGLLRPQSGSVQIGAETDRLTSTGLDGRVAIVPQEPFLFSGTVTENIVFGREGLLPVDVQRAARAARIHEDILRMAGGYDSFLEEGGRNLSRGQRQRIAIARALVGNPSLLILDEATASLDHLSERVICTTIAELRGKITIVLSAHRGELLKLADQTVELELGRVKAYSGSHSEFAHEYTPALLPSAEAQPVVTT